MWLLKEGVGVFLRVVIFPCKICSPHTQVSLALVMCMCSDSAMPLFSRVWLLAYATTANGVCLHLLVAPLAQYVLLL